jgi:hypothetical protein
MAALLPRVSCCFGGASVAVSPTCENVVDLAHGATPVLLIQQIAEARRHEVLCAADGVGRVFILPGEADATDSSGQRDRRIEKEQLSALMTSIASAVHVIVHDVDVAQRALQFDCHGEAKEAERRLHSAATQTKVRPLREWDGSGLSVSGSWACHVS